MNKEEREAHQKFVDDNIYCILRFLSPIGFSHFVIYLKNGIVFNALASPEGLPCQTSLDCRPFMGDYHTNWKDKNSKYFESFFAEDYDPLTDERNRDILFGWDWLESVEPELSILIKEYIENIDEDNPVHLFKNKSEVEVPWRKKNNGEVDE